MRILVGQVGAHWGGGEADVGTSKTLRTASPLDKTDTLFIEGVDADQDDPSPAEAFAISIANHISDEVTNCDQAWSFMFSVYRHNPDTLDTRVYSFHRGGEVVGTATIGHSADGLEWKYTLSPEKQPSLMDVLVNRMKEAPPVMAAGVEAMEQQSTQAAATATGAVVDGLAEAGVELGEGMTEAGQTVVDGVKAIPGLAVSITKYFLVGVIAWVVLTRRD